MVNVQNSPLAVTFLLFIWLIKSVRIIVRNKKYFLKIVDCHKAKASRNDLDLWPWPIDIDLLELICYKNLRHTRISVLSIHTIRRTYPPLFSTMVESLYNLDIWWLTMKFIHSFLNNIQRSVTAVCHNITKSDTDCSVDPDHDLDYASE